MPTVGHLPLGQGMAHEHGLDGLEVELGGEVHHGEVFVVKLAMLLRRIAVSLDQMLEQPMMRLDWRSRFMLTKPLSCRNRDRRRA